MFVVLRMLWFSLCGLLGFVCLIAMVLTLFSFWGVLLLCKLLLNACFVWWWVCRFVVWYLIILLGLLACSLWYVCWVCVVWRFDCLCFG